MDLPFRDIPIQTSLISVIFAISGVPSVDAFAVYVLPRQWPAQVELYSVPLIVPHDLYVNLSYPVSDTGELHSKSRVNVPPTMASISRAKRRHLCCYYSSLHVLGAFGLLDKWTRNGQLSLPIFRFTLSRPISFRTCHFSYDGR